MEPKSVTSPKPITAIDSQATVQNQTATPNTPRKLYLPVSVVGRVDVGRLVREVNAVNEFLQQAEIRQPGTPMQLPKSSRLMDEVVQFNKLNLLQVSDRAELTQFLTTIKTAAPTMHMSFSADPSPHFLNKLIKQIRTNIHPNVLLSVGLQPTIGAGCVIRTTNKYFDLSLRHDLTTKSALLMRTLRAAITQEHAPAAVATATADSQQSQNNINQVNQPVGSVAQPVAPSATQGATEL